MIERVAVLGAGVMGSGIAAHVANAGLPVVLLDVVAPDAADRSAIARGAVARMLKTEPAPFMHRDAARRVTPGNLEDDLGLVADADWIVEAVTERLDVKRSLYRSIDAVRKPGSIVSSNTSTIPLGRLVDGMPDAFRRDFLITHFFNPPRYMRLLELVAGPESRAESVALVRDFCDRALGKGVVDAKDTPGFIGNRIGVYWLQCAVAEAFAAGLDVEAADAVMGPPLGIPRTGVFGLLDLVGLDLMPHVIESLRETLDPADAFHAYAAAPALVERMIADGYTGRKGKGGFYRLRRDGGRRVKEAIDLATGEYRESVRPELACVEAARAGGVRALLEHPDPAAAWAWRVMSRTLHYAAGRVPEIADDVVAVDEAMRLGYNWKRGPFELIDDLGTAWLAERLAAEGLDVPPLLAAVAGRSFYEVREGRRRHWRVGGGYAPVARPDGVLLLADVRLGASPLLENESASLWDVGEGVACLEFHSKMNAIDPAILDLAERAVDVVGRRFRALVVYNEGEQFSVGANVGLALFAANIAAWDDIEQAVARGQQVYRALKYAPFPVVGAPAGMALGGGCEILLHCDAIVAHAETYAGLVEAGVGLVPAWGGSKEMLARWSASPARPGGPMPPVTRTFEMISTARVSRSAAEARDLLILRPGDEVVMNRDRVLARARARALELAPGYAPPAPPELRLPGPSAMAAMAMAVDAYRKLGRATAHDAVVAGELARVLAGGDTDVTRTLDEDALLALERAAFMHLVREPATIARIEHMLETGKPLRN